MEPVDGDARETIVSAEERQAGEELQATYAVFERNFLALTHDQLRERFKSAQNDYAHSPNDETLARLKQAAVEHTIFRAETGVRSQCRAALSAFVKDQVAPWATAILTRNLKAATAAAARVRAIENARCLKLTGRPLANSDIVAAAEAPVRQMQMILKQLQVETERSIDYRRSPAAFMTTFDAIGDPNFEALVDDAFNPDQVEKMLAEEQERARAEAEEESGLFPSD